MELLRDAVTTCVGIDIPHRVWQVQPARHGTGNQVRHEAAERRFQVVQSGARRGQGFLRGGALRLCFPQRGLALLNNTTQLDNQIILNAEHCCDWDTDSRMAPCGGIAIVFLSFWSIKADACAHRASFMYFLFC